MINAVFVNPLIFPRWLIGLKDDKEDDRSNSVTISAQKTFRYEKIIHVANSEVL